MKSELAKVEEKIARVEGGGKPKGGQRAGKPALVKRELEQLLEWKKRELRRLEEGGGGAGEGGGLAEVEKEIAVVREQVEGLGEHLRRREAVLREVRGDIERERGGR